MDRTGKLLLSADETRIHAFRQGIFIKLYEQSLYRFIQHVRPLKPMPERMKGGEPVVYGGLPIASFEQLVGPETMPYMEITGYGYSWICSIQGLENDYAVWREGVFADSFAAQPNEQNQANSAQLVIAAVKRFNLARTTPLEAMNAIGEWQRMLCIH